MKISCLILAACFALTLYGQHGHIQLAEDQRNKAEQLEIEQNKLFSFHLQLRPVNKTALVNEIHLKKQDSISSNEGQLIQDFVEVLFNEENRDSIYENNKPLLKHFYLDGTHLWSLYRKNFQLQLDPLLDFQGGYEDSSFLFANRRGIRLQGLVDDRVFFHTEIIESQVNTPEYVHDYIALYQAFPGAGLYKSFKSGLFKTEKAYDFLLAEAAVGIHITKHISVSLGHGKHFIGSGIRSVLLSDFASPYFYLRFNTNIWRLHYQNIFAELSPESLEGGGNRLLDKKYMASHYLSINLTKNWNAGIYESVIFSRDKGFELQYLNPVILYRFIEHSLGSPDNVLLGLHSNLLLANKFKLYGQVLFDEFLLKEFFAGNGWWGNKYAVQLGVTYVNALNIDNLNLQFEFNQARPFTYTFRDSLANYAHFNQALAHPLGANFNEFIVSAKYQLNERWNFGVKTIYFKKGLDSLQVNFGGNILKDYDTRVSDYNNETTQGHLQQVIQGNLYASYKLFYRCWLDANIYVRNNKNVFNNKNSFWFNIGLRMNLDKLRYDF